MIEHGDGGVGYVPVRRFVHGPGVDEPRVEYRRQPDGSHARLWLAADRQGSVAAASNDAGAAVPVTHGPFGEPGGAPGPRLRYTGQWLDPDTQLHHYRARWYSPWHGPADGDRNGNQGAAIAMRDLVETATPVA